MTETTNATSVSDLISVGLRKALNQHGYGFQYSVMKRCLDAEGIRPWRVTAAEYPVALNHVESHIDFILTQGTHIVVVECKRTTGWTWGFARSRDERRRPCADYMNLHEGRIKRSVYSFGDPNPPYDVCVEISGNHSDNDQARQQRMFRDALTQAIRGRSGLMDSMSAAGPELRYGGGAVVPVIFTTASLVTTETALVSADTKGNLPELATEERPWIWYDHNLSMSTQPTNVPYLPVTMQLTPNKSDLLRIALNRDSRRSIAVVNESGIEAFLSHLALSLQVSHDPLDLVTGF